MNVNRIADRHTQSITNLLRGALPAIVAVALCSPSATAAGQTFHGLGFLPGGNSSFCAGLSGDGTTIAGYSDGQMFRWSSAAGFQTFTGLPQNTGNVAMAISYDGSIVAGRSWMPDGTVHGFRWTADDIQDIGILPARASTYVYGMSSDGAAVVGQSGPNIVSAVRWTQSDGLLELVSPIPGQTSVAFGASSGGSVVVGVAGAGDDARAFRWTESGGMQMLTSIAGASSSCGYAVNDDGSVAVGFCSGSFGYRAVRWTLAGDALNLGVLPNGRASQAIHVSGDGLTIAGTATTEFYDLVPMLWNERIGTVNADSYFRSLGMDLTDWTITQIDGLSFNGRTLAGYGIHNGRPEVWIATLGCRADFNADDVLNFFDYLEFVDALISELPTSDFNSDRVIDFFDYLDFVDAFSIGC